MDIGVANANINLISVYGVKLQTQNATKTSN